MARAFISYSHADSTIAKRLIVHLSQASRDGVIMTWYDGQIPPGGELDNEIMGELEKADIFLAIISPDYLHSAYCYDVEFGHALEARKAGKMQIVPIIAQPCDWKPSPFGKLKAVPQDGKPISEFLNENNALLNVVDEIRRLVDNSSSKQVPMSATQPQNDAGGGRYKVKRDFDPVDILNFRDQSFSEIHSYFQKAIEEINGVEQLKARFVSDHIGQQFTCIVTNRAKIGTTGYISIGLQSRGSFLSSEGIAYSFHDILNPNIVGNGFSIGYDDYDLFWKKSNLMYSGREAKRVSAKEIAEILWDEFLDQVGVTR